MTFHKRKLFYAKAVESYSWSIAIFALYTQGVGCILLLKLFSIDELYFKNGMNTLSLSLKTFNATNHRQFYTNAFRTNPSLFIFGYFSLFKPQCLKYSPI